MKLPFKKLGSYLSIRKSIPITMNLTELNNILASECKKRTAIYFDRLKLPASVLSDKAIAAASIISSSNFGCAVPSVVALVSVILGEDIERLVTPKHRPTPMPGVVISFLSDRLAPGKRVPALAYTVLGDKGTRFVNAIEADSDHTLGENQIDGAEQPTDEQIDKFFTDLSMNGLRRVLGSAFGVETLTAG